MLRLAGIELDSIVDGPGIRVVIFCQGCLRHCEGCHNPATWDMDGGIEMSVDEVLKMIKSNPLCKGVTYSGGEPFLQAVELCELTRKLPEYEIAVYSGFKFEELLDGTPEQRELLSLIDVLIDGPYEISKRTLELSFRGSGNQRILNVRESLKAGKAVLETSERWV
ncbi:MAG: anaerobic ribonucleoside-triphosphate reductase activating protein [Synergistaceae bacterium]|nr:anaerobic ribonucleoside-triphosphate reductase activating protein [Synergistaceae bacterium]MBQ3759112.1 anaerobic ribonucleoside-triphosphate reductase activating protein [Synergistaceae bacterium]